MVRKVAVCPSRGWVELVVTVGPAAGRGRGRRPVQPLLTDLLLPRVRIVRCRRDRMEHFVVSDAGCAGQSWLVGEDLAEQPDRAFVIHSAEFSTGAQVRLNGTSSPRLRPGVAPRGIGGEPAKRGLSGGP